MAWFRQCLLSCSRLYLFSCLVRQCCTQITLTRAASDRHNQFAFVLRPLGYLQRRPYVGPGRNARQDPLLERQPPRRGKRVIVADRDNLVHDLQVEVLRDKPRSRALNLVRPRLEGFAVPRLRDDRRISRLASDGPKPRSEERRGGKEGRF